MKATKYSISAIKVLFASCLIFSLFSTTGCTRGYGCYYGAVEQEKTGSAPDAPVTGFKTVQTADETFDGIGE